MTYSQDPNQGSTQPVYPPDGWGEAEPQPAPPPPPVIHVPISARDRRTRRQTASKRPVRRGPGCSGCLPLLLIAAFLLPLVVAYFIFPGRTNILFLGIDYTEPGNSVARTDTIILSTFRPDKGYAGMLSIPRDLWVTVPGAGENRINTAHFFAEGAQAGSGPRATMDTIQQNFGVDVRYYVRIRFEGVRDIVDAMGGVDLNLTEPMAGYSPGQYHLTGRKALAFARHRQGADDFFRMEQGQFLLKSIFTQMLNPLKWVRIPAIVSAALRSVDTNVPVWLWPRLGFTLLRAGPGGIDSRTVTREMATSFTTPDGASVLLPDWSSINPVLLEMFGQ